MNIFEEYKNKILTIIKKAEKDKLLILPENLNGVNVDSTPPNIDLIFQQMFQWFYQNLTINLQTL